LEPVDVPHHVIPPGPLIQAGTPTAAPAAGGGHAGPSTPAPAIHGLHASLPHGLNLFTLLGITGLALAALGLAALLLRLVRPSSLSPAGSAGPPGGRGLGGFYVYEGLRAALRRIFLELRERASRITGRSVEWATAREVAALLGGGAASAFAREYEDLMYSTRTPGPGDLERLRRLAREAGGGEAG